MKEWEYLIDDDRRVTWNSSFPDNELDSSEYGLAFFFLHIIRQKMIT